MSGGVDRIDIETIAVADRLRAVGDEAVGRLADSIKEIGLRTPITVRAVEDGGLVLVSGAHRLAAVKQLGWTKVEAFVIENWSDLEARRWEIAENLHRADLTTLQRAEQVAEWIKITDELLAQVAPAVLSDGRKAGPQHLPSGINRAAKEIGVERTQAQRDIKVAGLTAEAKRAAREVGLDKNQRALIAASRAEPEKQADVLRNWRKDEAQVASIADMAQRRAMRVDGDVKERAAKEVAEIIAEYVPADAWDGLKANLFAAGASSIAIALTNLTGQSIMDRRYGESA